MYSYFIQKNYSTIKPVSQLRKNFRKCLPVLKFITQRYMNFATDKYFYRALRFACKIDEVKILLFGTNKILAIYRRNIIIKTEAFIARWFNLIRVALRYRRLSGEKGQERAPASCSGRKRGTRTIRAGSLVVHFFCISTKFCSN